MTVEIITPPEMARWRDVMRPEFRRRLYREIGERVRVLVRKHILRIAPAHHIWANRLGAQPTGHLTSAVGKINSAAGADFAEVAIPIPGISRAFHNLTITPKNKAALTIPIAAASYGHRVSELRGIGWAIFRPRRVRGAEPANQDSGVLFGKPQGGGEVVPLYLLKKRVEQRQDRTLLPSDAEIGAAAAAAITGTIDRIAKGAA